MNGKSQNPLSFVGAMKIARQPRILASTRMNGASHPGSLSEGAVERMRD